MGLNINQKDIQKLARDKKLMDEVIGRVLEAPKQRDSLAKEIVNKLADILEDDPFFKKKISNAALSNLDPRDGL